MGWASRKGYKGPGQAPAAPSRVAIDYRVKYHEKHYEKDEGFRDVRGKVYKVRKDGSLEKGGIAVQDHGAEDPFATPAQDANTNNTASD